MSDGLHPNDLWRTDSKGEFQLSDKRYCYPLTVTDYSSPYLLLCEALQSGLIPSNGERLLYCDHVEGMGEGCSILSAGETSKA